jgi:hypothetical protein
MRKERSFRHGVADGSTPPLSGRCWCKNHMWTAPACKGFEDRFGDLVGCGHMSGPLVRRIRPLALMEFADRVPIKIAR